MAASNVQLRIWAVGIVTTLLVAAAGAGMAPSRLGHARAPATLTGSHAGADHGLPAADSPRPEQNSATPAGTTR